MKQKQLILYSLALLIVVLMSHSACKKIPFDHRDKYLGDWTFDVHYHSFTMNEGVLYNYSETHNGKIEYGKEKSKILIKYAVDKSIELIIDEDGILSGFPTHYCSGSFKDKKNWIFTCDGADLEVVLLTA
ncbi:MAG: hypothetical protein RBS19_11005 [Bacteroidales bacterium]|nr:hypothetical protein [Bacteroidales bacterium]